MQRYATLDKSKILNFKIRIGETSIPKVLVFTNSDGSPYDISEKEWELSVRKSPSAKTDVFKLTEEDGLTVIGDDSNQLMIEVNATRATQRADVFFGLLRSATEDRTFLNGDWEFHNGKYDGITETESITISQYGESITIVISDASQQQEESGNPGEYTP